MLRRCLDLVRAQRRPPERVLVVDNASTDGTVTMMKEQYGEVDVLALPVNKGGAGGFYEGIKRAHADGAQWLWLLDDDTMPEADALGKLLAASSVCLDGRPPTLLASKVSWRAGGLHPMNFPTLTVRPLERVIAAARCGTMPLRASTFVSLLVHRGVIDRHGLPRKEFFLWSDDIEYTSRAIIGGEPGLFVPASAVLHDTPDAGHFSSASPERFYYHVRNTLLIARAPQRPISDRLLRLWVLVTTSARYVRQRHDRDSVVAVARGLRDGSRARAS
jgi:GT2 family glycosyltransferase